MHRKLSQAKGSIIVGNESVISRDRSPNQDAKGRDSSNLRVRLDDTDPEILHERSKSKISDKGPLSFQSDPPQRSNHNPLPPPEMDFDDLESINENIPAARQTELRRLREENQELKELMK